MLKSLMPSEETGLGPLFFSATDLSLVQVRCTFLDLPRPPHLRLLSGDGELLGQLGALWSWINCLRDERRDGARSFGDQRFCSQFAAKLPELHTSSSGFSSLSPAGNLFWDSEADGVGWILSSRIEPRDSSVILWI